MRRRRRRAGARGETPVTFRMFTAASAAALLFAAPASAQSLEEALSEAGRFETFLTALDASDAGWFLEEEEPYTLFAPTDEAFAELPDGVVDALLKEENRPKLNLVIEHHLVPDRTLSSIQLAEAADAAEEVDPAAGEPYAMSTSGGSVILDGAQIVGPDLETGHGIAHAVSGVMIPEVVMQAMKHTGDWPE